MSGAGDCCFGLGWIGLSDVGWGCASLGGVRLGAVRRGAAGRGGVGWGKKTAGMGWSWGWDGTSCLRSEADNITKVIAESVPRAKVRQSDAQKPAASHAPGSANDPAPQAALKIFTPAANSEESLSLTFSPPTIELFWQLIFSTGNRRSSS